jgi:hypothetical protein
MEIPARGIALRHSHFGDLAVHGIGLTAETRGIHNGSIQSISKEGIMKKLLLVVSVVALVLLPVGCDLEIEAMIRDVFESMLEDLTTTLTIKVMSVPVVGVNATGLNVTGEYRVVSAEYNESIDGMEFISQSYPVALTEIELGESVEFTVVDVLAVSAMFMKRTDDETKLRVEIWEGEDLIDWEETTETWGAVLVTAFP